MILVILDDKRRHKRFFMAEYLIYDLQYSVFFVFKETNFAFCRFSIVLFSIVENARSRIKGRTHIKLVLYLIFLLPIHFFFASS